MKAGPNANFPVFVQSESSQYDGEEAALFNGVVRVTLNHCVTVLFVPEVPSAPPWDFRACPDGDEPVATTVQAWQHSVLAGPYAVTPNGTLAGTVERITAPPEHPLAEFPAVIFYAGPDEFAWYTRELNRIEDEQLGPAPVADLRQYRVAGFLERLAASGHLGPTDAKMLGR